MSNRRTQPDLYYTQQQGNAGRRQPVTWLQAARIYITGSKHAQGFAAAHAVRLTAFVARTWPFLLSLLATFGIIGDDVTGVGVVDDPALAVSIPMLILTGAWMFMRVTWIKVRGIR